MAGKSPMQKLADEGKTPLAFQPDKGKGSSITLEDLQERYGKKHGLEVYYRVALVAWGDLRNMSYLTLPPLVTSTLKSAQQEGVEAVLAAADKEFKVTAEPATAEE